MIYETEKELRLGRRINEATGAPLGEATLDLSGTFPGEAIRVELSLSRDKVSALGLRLTDRS